MNPIMTQFIGMLVTSMTSIIVALIASNGFWSRLEKKSGVRQQLEELTKALNEANERDKKINARLDNLESLALGSAYNAIVKTGQEYMHKGSITMQEKADFKKYLYDPYCKANGNGRGELYWREIDRLPIVDEEDN